MFCNQCEQTFCNSACVNSPGVRGKSEDVQSLQELPIFGLKGMAAYAHHARRLGQSDESVSRAGRLKAEAYRRHGEMRP